MSVLSQISNCQGLGRKNKHDILTTDRMRPYIQSRDPFILTSIQPDIHAAGHPLQTSRRRLQAEDGAAVVHEVELDLKYGIVYYSIV